jgi:hypothetical protein
MVPSESIIVASYDNGYPDGIIYFFPEKVIYHHVSMCS